MRFVAELGADLPKYRNHVYRVYNNCLLIDGTKENQEKYAIAAVFHDIGIWTNHTIDYLAPSIEQAKQYLTSQNRQSLEEEISLMIFWHHKISRYRGASEQTTTTFRKADWIDVSLGLVRFGLKRKEISKIREDFPNLGFHRFLLRKLIRNLFRHPLRPLPMFRR